MSDLRFITIQTQRRDVPTGVFLGMTELCAWLREQGHDDLAAIIETTERDGVPLRESTVKV